MFRKLSRKYYTLKNIFYLNFFFYNGLDLATLLSLNFMLDPVHNIAKELPFLEWTEIWVPTA